MIYFFISTTVVLLLICLLLARVLNKQEARFVKEREKIKNSSKFRSSAVNWGKSIEHFVPFMDKFPVPVEDVHFLGQPVDLIAYTDTNNKTKCTIHFIEVKSGNAFLSSKQKNIKKAIEEGRVKWHEVRVKSNKLEEVKEEA